MVKRASPRLIFSRNDIFEASGPGVIVTGGTPLFLGNRIHNNSSTGVRLYSVRSNPTVSMATSWYWLRVLWSLWILPLLFICLLQRCTSI